MKGQLKALLALLQPGFHVGRVGGGYMATCSRCECEWTSGPRRWWLSAWFAGDAHAHECEHLGEW
jgi:hypothetical protein